MAVVGINYSEGSKKKNLGYKSVYVFYGNGKREEKIFDSGDFVKDWYDYRKFLIQELSEKEHAFCNSSTVDHFIMDGAPYDSAYLIIKNKKGELYYGNEFYEKGIEFFVNKGTKPTWQELKDKYNNG